MKRKEVCIVRSADEVVARMGFLQKPESKLAEMIWIALQSFRSISVRVSDPPDKYIIEFRKGK